MAQGFDVIGAIKENRDPLFTVKSLLSEYFSIVVNFLSRSAIRVEKSAIPTNYVPDKIEPRSDWSD
jgi:hypothetical protein